MTPFAVTGSAGPSPVKRSDVPSARGPDGKASAFAPIPQRGDSHSLSSAPAPAPPATDWQAFADELSARLGGNVRLTAATLDPDQLYDFAASAGPGAQLVLSQEFLQEMVSSEAAYAKGKALIAQLIDQLQQQALQDAQKSHGVYTDGQTATFWMAEQPEEESLPSRWTYESESEMKLLELMKEAFSKAKERDAKFKIKLSPSIYQSRVEAMARLARAKTVPETRSAASMARRSISSLKMALSLGDEKDKPKIRATIVGLEKIITRSARKIRDLDAESLLRKRREKAEQDQLRRRAQQAMQELRQRKTARHAREYGQLKLERDELWLQRLREAHGDLAGDVPAVSAVPDAAAPIVPAPPAGEVSAAVTFAPPVEIAV